MSSVARTAIATLAGAVVAVGGGLLAEVGARALAPVERGLPLVPLRVDAVPAFGPHGLRAVVAALVLGPLVALLAGSAADHPSLRRAAGVLLAAAALAALVVAVVQARAADPIGGSLVDLGGTGLVLGATFAVAAGLAIVDRDPLGPRAPAGATLVAVGVPLAIAVALGWPTLRGALA